MSMQTIDAERSHPLAGPMCVAENIWRMDYPLSVLGNEHGRVVTIIRLKSGKLIIHSTAPFSAADVSAIHALGEPGWLVEVNLLHDTFAKQGREAFPSIPYLAPAGFTEGSGLEVSDLSPAPAEWQDEVRTTLIEGMPRMREHLFCHVASRTLIVGDLVQNFDEKESAYAWILRHVAMGLHEHPDVNRLVAAMVTDRTLFAASIARVMDWDFGRLIVAHKQMIETGAKQTLRAALERAFPDLKF